MVIIFIFYCFGNICCYCLDLFFNLNLIGVSCFVSAPRKSTPSKAGDKADKKDILKATPKDDKKEEKKDVGKIEASKCVTSFFKTSRYVLCLFLTKHISVCM